MKLLTRLVVAMSVCLGFLVIGPVTVLADCDGPVPSFREYATSADRVVIGTVSAVDLASPWRDDGGASSRFTLRVEHPIRGTFGPTVAASDLAYLDCADHVLMARKGDRIALALGARAFGQRINTAAWIDGTPFPFAERISVRETFALFDQHPPDTSMTEPPTTQATDVNRAWLVLVAVFVVSLGLAITRRPDRSGFR